MVAGTAASSEVIKSLPAVASAASSNSLPSVAEAAKSLSSDGLTNSLSTLIGALVGALAGAMLAYWLQRRLQTHQERKAAMMSAHRMMFSLLQQINTIVLIQRDYVYEHLNDPIRFLSIGPSAAFDANKNILQWPDLSFLIDSVRGRAILHDLYLAQENYIEAVNQWNMRSQTHLEKVQPALAASGIANGSKVTLEQIEIALGRLVYGVIQNSTNNCVECLSRAFVRLADVKVRARAYIVERFETNDFTDFDFPETFGLTQITAIAQPEKPN